MAIKDITTFHLPTNQESGHGSTNHKRAKQRVGQSYGMLLILEHLGSNNYRQAVYECQCDCGKLCIKSFSRIKDSPNCGCIGNKGRSDYHLKHGGTKRSGQEPLYKIWLGMKRRCYRESSHDFKWYGGRGITMSDRWLDYANFRNDMLPTYKPGLSIERIDPDGNYEPGNCEWITLSENARRAATQKHKRTKHLGLGKTQLANAEAKRLGRDLCWIAAFGA